MLNQGPEGQWSEAVKFLGFDTAAITFVFLFAPFDSIIYLHVPV